MEYSHLSTFERGRVDVLHQLGWSCRAIVKVLNRHYSTIAREFIRYQTENGSDSPEKAQSVYVKRRLRSRPQGKWTEEIARK